MTWGTVPKKPCSERKAVNIAQFVESVAPSTIHMVITCGQSQMGRLTRQPLVYRRKRRRLPAVCLDERNCKDTSDSLEQDSIV